MSTEFRSTTTDRLGFVRFYGGPERGTCFEFGTVSQFERVCTAMRAGDRFEPFAGNPLNDDPETVDAFTLTTTTTTAEFVACCATDATAL